MGGLQKLLRYGVPIPSGSTTPERLRLIQRRLGLVLPGEHLNVLLKLQLSFEAGAYIFATAASIQTDPWYSRIGRTSSGEPKPSCGLKRRKSLASSTSRSQSLSPTLGPRRSVRSPRQITAPPNLRRPHLGRVIEEIQALASVEVERAKIVKGYRGRNAPKPLRDCRSGQKRRVFC